jgi:hypothetical protein
MAALRITIWRHASLRLHGRRSFTRRALPIALDQELPEQTALAYRRWANVWRQGREGLSHR